jgi:hypothetical protein
MKSCLPALTAVFASLAISAAADTFEMKDGSKLEGQILREDETSYVLEVQVTRTIKDERVVPKDQVVAIQRATPDLKEFEKIASLVPAPDMLKADQYAARIRSVEKFLAEHPKSEKAGQARKILAELKAEANEVIDGGIKMSGTIVPPAEYRANQLEIDARMQELGIRSLLNQRNTLQALRAFLAFDQQFRGTEPHSALRPLIIQAINSHLAEANELLASYDGRVRERQAGLDRMGMDIRRTTEAAIAEENADLLKRFEAEKSAKVGWVTIHPYLKPSLEETLTFGKQELTRLSTTPSPPPADTGKIFRDTLLKIRGTSNPSALSNAINEARSSGMPPKYLAILEAAAKPAP